MKKFSWLILPLLLLTSCIDISEEISINPSGSGTYQATIDVSEIHDMMMAMKTDSSDDGSGEDSFAMGMMKSLKESADKYRNIPGIRNVHYSQVGGMQKYNIGFDFDNIKALNGATREQGQDDKYAWKKGQFTINNPGFNPTGTSGEDEENAEMARMMLADAKYNITVIVPKKAKKCSNEDAEINKRVVTLSTTLGEIMKEKSGLNMSIKYK